MIFNIAKNRDNITATSGPRAVAKQGHSPEDAMLSQSSITSKSRTAGWAKSFLGTPRREPVGGAAREQTEFSDAKTPQTRDGAGAK